MSILTCYGALQIVVYYYYYPEILAGIGWGIEKWLSAYKSSNISKTGQDGTKEHGNGHGSKNSSFTFSRRLRVSRANVNIVRSRLRRFVRQCINKVYSPQGDN